MGEISSMCSSLIRVMEKLEKGQAHGWDNGTTDGDGYQDKQCAGF